MRKFIYKSLVLLVAVALLFLAACSDKPADSTSATSQPIAANSPASVEKPLRVSEVTDVRIQSSETGKIVIGSIIGEGFKPGDLVIINGRSQFPAIIGNEQWVTFSFPVGELKDKDDFSLEVLRPSTQERTKPLPARPRKTP